MPHGKQAKRLTPKHETAVLTYLQTRRYPVRDWVMFFSRVANLTRERYNGLPFASLRYKKARSVADSWSQDTI